LADQNFRVKHGISIDTNRLVDVNRNINAGVTTFAHTKVTGITTVGIISATNGAGGMGIVTFQSQVAIESGAQRITIAPPSQNAGFVSSYNLTLPAKAGTDGQVLTYGPNGILGFNTNGLYENRYYVSSANGDDSFDGRSKPFATIKKAAQAASFRSFQLPGGRYLDAGNLLALNKSFIQHEVVSYLEFNYPNITTDKPDYDRATCIRDVGYIVDAIVYDLSFGGNSKTVEAALAYWVGGVSYVAGEEEEALHAYNYINFLGQYVINNQTPPTLYQTSISQQFDFTVIDDPANVNSNYFHRRKDARNRIVANRQEIIDKSLAAVAIAHSDFYFPGEQSTNTRSRFYDSYRLIQQNRQTIINYAYAGIATAYPSFVQPNPAKCQRDLGYFVDAVSTDVFTGGNSYSREFVFKYFTGVGIGSLAGEEQQTIYAFRYAGTLMKEALTNQLPIKDLTITADPATGSNTSAASCANVQSNVDNLVGIVTTTIGAGSTAGIATANNGYFAGITTSCNVVCGSIGIGSTNIIGGRKCARDLGYIVDAIAQDISYGSNQHIVYATKKYFNGAGAALTTGLLGEEAQSITAFVAAREYAKKAITNQLNSQDLTIIADAATGFNTDPASCANIQTNIDNIVGILTVAIGNSSLATVPAPGIGTITDCADVRSAVASYVGIITSVIGIGTTAAPAVSLPTTLSKPIAIIVEAGDYVEDNPIILYEDVAVLGDNLRNTIIRPQNAGKDLFRVRNGCYITNFAMKDNVDAAGVPQFTFDNAVAFDDPSDPFTSRTGYATKTTKSVMTRSPYVQNASILSFLGANGILVDGSKVATPNVPIVSEEVETPVLGAQPEQGKSMVAAAFTMVSFGGIGWRVINDGYSQVVSCFQIFCRYGSLAQSGGYLSITNSATNFGFYALRSTGFSQNSFFFDRGRIAATGTSGGLQTLRVVGLGRTDQDLYVTRFFNNSLSDLTSNFKPVVTQATVSVAVGVNTVTDRITIVSHPFTQGDTVLYLGDENATPKVVIEGLVSGNQYYLNYIDNNTFTLYEDDSFTRLVDLKSAPVGINTFQKGNIEFFANEIIDTHNSYQVIGIATTGGTPQFTSGRQVTQTVSGGTAVGYAVTYNNTSRELLVSVETSGGIRRFFGVSGGANGQIADHQGSPVNFYTTTVTGVSTYYTIETTIASTPAGTTISGIASLPQTYYCHFHRPSIVNSSGHTWEYSGSGIDYNALPQNGGKTNVATEQTFSLGGRVYSSGTNELGDFKVGNFITAYNRTGNIIFNNKVTIGQLDSLRLSLSGGVAVEEFSTDVGLGDNETGGAKNSRVSTQLAVRTFLNNRLGNVIDKTVSTNAVPSAIVQLNATGQINADLIPPKVVNYYRSNVSGGRTELVDQIPPINVLSGDTVLEPGQGYVLTQDVFGQFLKLSSNTANYNFPNGFTVTSAGSAGGAIGVVTAPTSVGYGTTGLVKGVLLSVSITSGGSGYTNPGVYTCVLDRSTGIGTSARASITVSGSGTVTGIDIDYGGRYYASGDVLTINNDSLLGGRSGGARFNATVGGSGVETRLYLRLTNNQKFTGSSTTPDYIEDGDAVGVSTSLTSTYTVNFDPTDISTGGNVDFANDRIVVGVTTLTDGDPIVYTANGGNVVQDLTGGETYFIKRVGISSVELYTTYALSTKLTLSSSGTGTHSIVRSGINTAENAIVFEKHVFSTGDAVRVTGSVPVGVTTGNYYYIGSKTTNSFTLHEARADAIASINGSTFNAVGLATASGTMTFTKQNVTYNGQTNTSSNLIDNYTVLASGVIDAANITSGTVSPSRLGSGTANSDTFLRGDSVFEKVVKSVGIATTEPVTVTGSSFDAAPGGVGVNTYYGKVNISINRVASTLENFSTLGVAKFRTSTFSITSNGEVSIKSSATGDVDAATLGGQAGAYYLNPVNFTGSVPISKGGTGLSALPSAGSILQGNGTGYDLVTSPTLSGNLTLTAGGNFIAVGAAITNANISGFGTVANLGSTNATISGIATYSGSGNNINQTAGTAALNRLTVTGITTFTGQANYGTISGTTLTNTGTANITNINATGVVTFSGSGNHINCQNGTAVFNRAVFSGISTFLGLVNVGSANYTTVDVGGTLTTQNFVVTGVSTLGRLQVSNTTAGNTLTMSGVSTFTGTVNTNTLTMSATSTATLPNITNTNTVTSGITTFSGSANNINQTAGTAAINRLTVAGISTFTGLVNYGSISGTTITNSGTAALTNQTVSGITTFSGSANNINQTAGTAALNRLTVAGVSTLSGNLTLASGSVLTISNTGNSINQTAGTAQLNNVNVVGVTTVQSLFFTSLGGSAGATLPSIANTNITISGVATYSGAGNNINQTAGTAALNRLTVAGVSTFTGQLNAGTISATSLAGTLNNTLTISSPLTGTSYNNSAAVTLGINATSANTANFVVQRGASGEFTAGAITATGLTLNGGGSTTSAQLTFSGTTNNWINFGTTGVAAPAFTTRSVGTKVVYYTNLSGSSADYAAGIEGSTLWHSVPTTSEQFRWYGGTTLAATLTGAGVFTAVGTVQGTRLISTIATGTAPLTVTSTTQVSNLNASLLEGYATATANTGNTIVRRDASGNFTAGTITSSQLTCTGNILQTTGGSFHRIAYTSADNSYSATMWWNGLVLGNNGTNFIVAGRTNGGGSLAFYVNNTSDLTSNTTPGGTLALTLASTGAATFGSTVSATTYTSTVATGTAPLTVTSTTQVTNLNAQYLNGLLSATANTANTIVSRNASGNFSAGTITATSFSGSLANTLTLNTSGTGLSGSTTFNNSGAATFTVTSNATSANTGSAIVARDASGNFSAGTITATLSGTASNVTSISSATGGSYTWTSTNYFRSNLGSTSGSLSDPPLQAYSTGSNAAFMSFHRGGSFAVNMGLDSDNVLRIGGWSASANRFQLDMSGNGTFAGTVTANSDIRLKKNIFTIENALDKVLNLRGVEFDRIDSGEHQMGVVAQEIEEVIPFLVREDNTGTKSVAYANMVGLLIEAIKEQNVLINNLQTEVKLLKTKLGE
jgi:hypothetical protein